MNELSTEVKKYILQAYTGKEYDLTQQQHDSIMAQSTSGKVGGFWIDGEYLAFTQIKSITKIEEPIKEYPRLPAVGFDGMINRLNSKEVRANAIKQWEKMVEERKARGEPYQNLQAMIDKLKSKKPHENKNRKGAVG